MKNNKNTVIKPMVSIGFDKTGNVESFVNMDRVNSLNSENLENVKREIASIAREITHTLNTSLEHHIAKHVLTQEQYNMVISHLDAGSPLSAIKRVKETLEIGLREAKQIVDSIMINRKS